MHWDGMRWAITDTEPPTPPCYLLPVLVPVPIHCLIIQPLCLSSLLNVILENNKHL
jgi:hypothetical protein